MRTLAFFHLSFGKALGAWAPSLTRIVRTSLSTHAWLLHSFTGAWTHSLSMILTDHELNCVSLLASYQVWLLAVPIFILASSMILQTWMPSLLCAPQPWVQWQSLPGPWDWKLSRCSVVWRTDEGLVHNELSKPEHWGQTACLKSLLRNLGLCDLIFLSYSLLTNNMGIITLFHILWNML